MKKPLSIVVSVKSRSETAVAEIYTEQVEEIMMCALELECMRRESVFCRKLRLELSVAAGCIQCPGLRMCAR